LVGQTVRPETIAPTNSDSMVDQLFLWNYRVEVNVLGLFWETIRENHIHIIGEEFPPPEMLVVSQKESRAILLSIRTYRRVFDKLTQNGFSWVFTSFSRFRFVDVFGNQTFGAIRKCLFMTMTRQMSGTKSESRSWQFDKGEESFKIWIQWGMNFSQTTVGFLPVEICETATNSYYLQDSATPVVDTNQLRVTVV
jgi:hypothetical protein